jgi:hypothetical protein
MVELLGVLAVDIKPACVSMFVNMVQKRLVLQMLDKGGHFFPFNV